jgi:hypothetical protein
MKVLLVEVMVLVLKGTAEVAKYIVVEEFFFKIVMVFFNTSLEIVIRRVQNEISKLMRVA